MQVRANHTYCRWLKSYRSYKFPFIGRPALPPDVYSATLLRLGKGSTTTTIVHVSWNGATEVASWNLYKTNREGRSGTTPPTASVPRSGFETSLRYDGYAKYVVVEALDSSGQVLGTSRVVKTVITQALTNEEIADEEDWLQRVDSKAEVPSSSSVARLTYGSKLASLVVIFLGCLALLSFGFRYLRARRKGLFSKHPAGPSYERVPSSMH